MNRKQAVDYMTTIAREHVIESAWTDDGTDVDLDALVGACVEHFGLDRESFPLSIWDWAIDAAALFYRSAAEPSPEVSAGVP